MAQLLAAGESMVEALGRSTGVPARSRLTLARTLSSGSNLADRLAEGPAWWPREDRLIVIAGAESGRLVEVFHLLSRKHRELEQQSREAISASLYPVFVVHFAALVLPIPELIIGSTGVYAVQVATILVPLWAAIAVIGIAVRKRASWLGLLLGVLPGLRAYRRAAGFADLSDTLEGLVGAGVTVSRAWRQAGAIALNRSISREAGKVADFADRGGSPSDYLSRSARFPQDFLSLYTVGEKAGMLEENLHVLATMFRERARASLAASAFWYPKILFILVAGWVALRIVSFYSEYYRQLDPLL